MPPTRTFSSKHTLAQDSRAREWLLGSQVPDLALGAGTNHGGVRPGAPRYRDRQPVNGESNYVLVQGVLTPAGIARPANKHLGVVQGS